MVVNKQTTLFDGATSTGSATLSTYGSDSASIQVDGTFTGLTLKVQGRLLGATSWEDIGVIKLADNSKISSIDAKGIYALPVDVLYEARVTITAISSGSVSVYAQSFATTRN